MSTTGMTESHVDWSINFWGDVEFYHVNEQHALVLTAQDIKEISYGMSVWQEEEDERNHQKELEQSQKDYEQYLILKERFEK